MNTLNNIIIYLFNPTPGRSFAYYYFISTLIVVLFLLGLFLKLYIKKNKEDKTFKKLFKQEPKKLWYLTIILLVYLFVRYYYVPFFSMRMLLFITIGVIIYKAYQLINIYLKLYPAEKKLREEKLEKKKYSIKRKPKKKKKRK